MVYSEQWWLLSILVLPFLCSSFLLWGPFHNFDASDGYKVTVMINAYLLGQSSMTKISHHQLWLQMLKQYCHCEIVLLQNYQEVLNPHWFPQKLQIIHTWCTSNLSSSLCSLLFLNSPYTLLRCSTQVIQRCNHSQWVKRSADTCTASSALARRGLRNHEWPRGFFTRQIHARITLNASKNKLNSLSII